jgi:hypothetical protein
LKPLQSWQVVLFSPYEYQEIQIENSFHLILCLGFNLGCLKTKLITLKKDNFAKDYQKDSNNKH